MQLIMYSTESKKKKRAQVESVLKLKIKFYFFIRSIVYKNINKINKQN